MPEGSKPKPAETPATEREGQERQAASAVLDDLESLRNRAGTAEKERDQYLALLQRTRADFENYQKRFHRDLAEERRYAHSALARDLLTVLDNLERALEAAREKGEKGPLIQGVTMVQAQLLDVFRRFGITRLDARSQPFDPSQHEAVLEEPRSDLVPGTVTRVLEPGYRLHERVLRPARVAVSSPPRREKETSRGIAPPGRQMP
jgi:molecular chaperone GrpE